MDAPCYKCEDRKVGCHGVCEKYKRFQKERESIKREERLENMAVMFQIERIMKGRKK